MRFKRLLVPVCWPSACRAQVVKGLPLPLLKICDFGYSKADSMSVAKSKVGWLSILLDRTACEVRTHRKIKGQRSGRRALPPSPGSSRLHGLEWQRLCYTNSAMEGS